MKKLVAVLVLVAFTFAVQAQCTGSGGCAKKDGDKAKTEGKCPAGDKAKKDAPKA